MKSLLKIPEVAEQLNVSCSFVYQAISEGRLKFFRLGKGQGGLRISQAQIDDFLASAEVSQPSLPEGLKHLR